MLEEHTMTVNFSYVAIQNLIFALMGGILQKADRKKHVSLSQFLINLERNIGV